MAKEILVTESLSNAMMKAGAKIIERLDRKKAEVKSAFWLYMPEEKIWKLMLASPIVDSEGPREYYKKIVAVNELAAKSEKIISLHHIAVINISAQIVQLLQFAIRTDDGISGIRFSKNAIKGIFIEDVYIYRSNT